MAKNQYKLLVVDIDGTVMGRNGTISNEDKKALVRVGDSGIRVSLSTGRVIQSSLEVIDELALDGLHMFFDGALVFNLEKGEEIF
ncbi:MAG: HAD hydrolase family protein, partial [Dehalococcoidales bacterium]|nr:HAD hydrolase family protein [Dehalococcoidales bacterium]